MANQTEHTARVLVLNYHRIADIPPDSPYVLSTALFKAHMHVLQRLGIPVIALKNRLNAKRGFSVALTFDDGCDSDYETVYPVLKKYGFTAAFFPVVNTIDTPNHITWQQLGELAQQGFTIGSHSMSHTVLDNLPLQQQVYELQQSKNKLENKLGLPVEHFSYPYGKYTDQTLALAHEIGYTTVWGTEKKINTDYGFLAFRWNLKFHDSVKKLENILQTQGRLSHWESFSSRLKHETKKILGTSLSNRINRFIH